MHDHVIREFRRVHCISNLSVWSLHKGVLPEDVDECHLGFQESKPHTNTITWAPSEWHVAELGPLLLLFRPEPEEEHRISDKKTLELTLHP